MTAAVIPTKSAGLGSDLGRSVFNRTVNDLKSIENPPGFLDFRLANSPSCEDVALSVPFGCNVINDITRVVDVRGRYLWRWRKTEAL